MNRVYNPIVLTKSIIIVWHGMWARNYSHYTMDVRLRAVQVGKFTNTNRLAVSD